MWQKELFYFSQNLQFQERRVFLWQQIAIHASLCDLGLNFWETSAWLISRKTLLYCVTMTNIIQFKSDMKSRYH